MPNPRIQIIVETSLKKRLEAAARKQGKTLSAYCAEILSVTHYYPWLVMKAPKALIAILSTLVKKVK